MSLHIQEYVWDLDVAQCPCDVHFLELLAERGIEGKRIFHFGTGNHHVVGLRSAESGQGHSILGITATPKEYTSYMDLVIEKPLVGSHYKVFFGDIYQLDGRLLPRFDIVNLFHLCEFRAAKNDAYGALDDRALALMLLEHLEPGGLMIFYTGSFAYPDAAPIVDALEREGRLEAAGTFSSLRLTRKPA